MLPTQPHVKKNPRRRLDTWSTRVRPKQRSASMTGSAEAVAY